MLGYLFKTIIILKKVNYKDEFNIIQLLNNESKKKSKKRKIKIEEVTNINIAGSPQFFYRC
jgi:division protein CdvB (Snf7/Vps24/ESCRT-III family)